MPPKARKDYPITIEYYIPKRELPGTPAEQWEYTLAILRDVLEMYPTAGVTVTRCPCPVQPITGKPNCREGCAKTLTVTGADQSQVHELIKKSEAARQFWE